MVRDDNRRVNKITKLRSNLYMNKTELIAAIAEATDISKKDTEKVLAALQNVVTNELISGKKVSLTGFMSFEPVDVDERKCRNPQTGGMVISPAHKKVRVKVGKTLKDAVNA